MLIRFAGGDEFEWADSLGSRAGAFLGLSKKFGDLVQGCSWQRFKGSRTRRRRLRCGSFGTTAAPAIAVEISSIVVEDRSELDRMARALRTQSRGRAFKPSYVVPSTPGACRDAALEILGNHGLIFAVVGAAIYFPILRRRVKRAARLQQRAKSKPGGIGAADRSQSDDPRVKTKTLLGIGRDGLDADAVVVELPLANDRCCVRSSAEHAAGGACDVELRTLRRMPCCWHFTCYRMERGSRFFGSAATSVPSGLLATDAVDSIARERWKRTCAGAAIEILIMDRKWRRWRGIST